MWLLSCFQFLIQVSILATLLSTSSTSLLWSSTTISSSYDSRASSRSTSMISESRFSCSFRSGYFLAFSLSYSFVESVRNTTTRSIQFWGKMSHECQSMMWPPRGSSSSKESSSWRSHQPWHATKCIIWRTLLSSTIQLLYSSSQPSWQLRSLTIWLMDRCFKPALAARISQWLVLPVPGVPVMMMLGFVLAIFVGGL